MEKNQNIFLAKELFACWDTARLGHININDLAENLISFGLAISKDQVVKLIKQLGFKSFKRNKSSNQSMNKANLIEMRDFIKIFEKDSFSDRAVMLIKEECKKRNQKHNHATVEHRAADGAKQ